MTMNTRDLPAGVYDASLPLPNVYFCTVTHLTGNHTLYVAADNRGAAIQKVRRYCAEHLGFRPYRSTSEIRLRRYRLADYLEHPGGLQAAYEVAQLANERDTMAKLAQRRQEIETVMAELQQASDGTRPDLDWAVIEEQLGEALRAV